MKVAKYESLPWSRNAGVRGGTPDQGAGEQLGSSRHRRMFKGTFGEPGHFEMVVLWSEQGDEGSTRHFPRHRHTFDQVRLSLTGSPEWSPGVPTPPGAINYIPAGTWYGPYDRYAGHSQLHIQFEGANGFPYADHAALANARDELAKTGVFEEGFYKWVDEDGQSHARDGHDAGAERAIGRPLEYPAPRYSIPINIEPEHFDWIDEQPGVAVKELGRFSERETRLAMLRLASADLRLRADGQTTLLFVTSGTGEVDGQSLEQHDGVMLDPDDEVVLSSTAMLEVLLLALPKLARLSASSSALAAHR
jgi:hypothetical protein